MKKKAQVSTDMPQTEQRRYPVPCSELGETNAIPRSTEYDLEQKPGRTQLFRPDEQTFCVVKKGNCP